MMCHRHHGFRNKAEPTALFPLKLGQVSPTNLPQHPQSCEILSLLLPLLLLLLISVDNLSPPYELEALRRRRFPGDGFDRLRWHHGTPALPELGRGCVLLPAPISLPQEQRTALTVRRWLSYVFVPQKPSIFPWVTPLSVVPFAFCCFFPVLCLGVAIPIVSLPLEASDG